jgi:putative tryptophan/tyrosine transport system substrate-binding protein
MRRRDLLIAAVAMLALPSPAGAQAKVWRIAFLSPLSGPEGESLKGAFLRGMLELGYASGKNFVLVERYADGKNDRLAGLAAELVQLNVDLIFAPTVQAVSAAQQATTSIPIVFVAVSDPVKSGFADTVARPARNLTGLSNFAGELAPKRLELIKTLLPKLSRIAILVNPDNPLAAGNVRAAQAAAERLGLRVVPVNAATADQIELAFAAAVRERVGSILVTGDVYHFSLRERIAVTAAKHRIALISPFREYAEAGGLMSYGTDVAYQFRYAATYVDKILRGARPGDLPIEQPAKFELVINRRTATAIALAIPQELLLRADRVIE